VLTDTDIPPGGEGKIEVSFDTKGKRGTQKKTITVTSNDPVNPTTTLSVSATVVIEFGFELYALNFGRLLFEQSMTKTAPLLIRDADKVQVAEVTSDSRYVTTRIASPATSTSGRAQVEVTVLPGMPIGFFTAEITARSSQATIPPATLTVSGTILGNVEAMPPEIRYKLIKEKPDPAILTQKVSIRSTRDTGTFRIVSVEDPDNRLTLKLDTVTAGREFTLFATLKQSAIDAGEAQGTVLVRTDDSTQSALSIPYNVMVRSENSPPERIKSPLIKP
jgi:hypothetical protein